MTVLCCIMEWGLASKVTRVDIGVESLDEHVGYHDVTIENRDMQGRPTKRIYEVDHTLMVSVAMIIAVIVAVVVVVVVVIVVVVVVIMVIAVVTAAILRDLILIFIRFFPIFLLII